MRYTNSYKWLIIQSLLILTVFLYGLVTPTHVCYVSGLPQALVFSNDMPFLKRRVLGSPSHACYVSGLPQAFLIWRKDMPFCFKACFCQKLALLVNICQYLSIFINVPYSWLNIYVSRATNRHSLGNQSSIGNIL